MQKFTPYEKLSKKKQRELNALKRSTWEGFNPVTRKPENPNAYKRSKSRSRYYEDGSAIIFCSRLLRC